MHHTSKLTSIFFWGRCFQPVPRSFRGVDLTPSEESIDSFRGVDYIIC